MELKGVIAPSSLRGVERRHFVPNGVFENNISFAEALRGSSFYYFLLHLTSFYSN